MTATHKTEGGTPISVRILEVGLLGVNCALLTRDGRALVIDPGGDAEVIDDALDGATLEAILITHGHYDHIGGLQTLRARHPDAAVVAHPDAAAYLTDPTCNLSLYVGGTAFTADPPTRTVVDGERLTLAGIELQVYHIPGHCHGQVAYGVEALGMVFCGDTVFAGSVGRSDLAGGDGEALASAVRGMLSLLPGDTVLVPGHGPQTTAAHELQTNPYL